ACMLRDPAILSWFKPSFANVDSEFPNPFFGVETEEDRDGWPGLSLAAKCALRWRGAVRLAARLRRSLPAEQLITVRYETLIEQPDATVSAISTFAGLPLAAAEVREPSPGQSIGAGGWRRALTTEQAADVEKVAGEELRRVGYALSSGR
ncbi:MAG TPA: sulfotransferase, partial [Streptosporangiaceae bacterium]|nr:sulfotransferase [Streptosporangiaceae bacterium]